MGSQLGHKIYANKNLTQNLWPTKFLRLQYYVCMYTPASPKAVEWFLEHLRLGWLFGALGGEEKGEVKDEVKDMQLRYKHFM